VLGLRLDADYVDQSADQAGADLTVVRGSIGLVYYPLGRTELGGGEGGEGRKEAGGS
jgi:hypothetical protein